MSHNIGKAIFAYHDAVADNLKESGKEYGVFGDYEDGKVSLTILDDNCSGAVNYVIDKVRYNKENEQVEIHICEEDYRECDTWTYGSFLGDNVDYVYDSIDWGD